MTIEDGGGVRITNKEIYEGLMKLTATVERLGGALAARKQTITDHESRLRVLEVNQANPKVDHTAEARDRDHEKRIRDLEAVANQTNARRNTVSVAVLLSLAGIIATSLALFVH